MIVYLKKEKKTLLELHKFYFDIYKKESLKVLSKIEICRTNKKKITKSFYLDGGIFLSNSSHVP